VTLVIGHSDAGYWAPINAFDTCGGRAVGASVSRFAGRGTSMAAMKPRTGDGPLEVTKEGRGIVMRVPLEGGGRLVVELTPDEADALGEALKKACG
jgi:Protein of unknown function (DUF3117)